MSIIPPIRERAGKRTIRAFGYLHKIGDQEPYFSLTGEIYGRSENGIEQIHKILIKEWPELKPLANLHFSTMDGVPLHCFENGWYWIAGALGGLGERWHGGTHGDGLSEAECLTIVAEHFRISMVDAEILKSEVSSVYDSAKLEAIPEVLHVGMVNEAFRESFKIAREAAKNHLEKWIDKQRPRWKSEAERCIRSLDLKTIQS